MEAPSEAGGFFYEFLISCFLFLLNCVRFFFICSFGLNQKNQKFKASEREAKMFARKPKTSETRLSAQTTEVFAAPSLHFYASLSGGRTSFAFLLFCFTIMLFCRLFFPLLRETALPTKGVMIGSEVGADTY